MNIVEINLEKRTAAQHRSYDKKEESQCDRLTCELVEVKAAAVRAVALRVKVTGYTVRGVTVYITWM